MAGQSNRAGSWALDSPIPVRAYSFPPGFRFGASTSAYQIEGATDEVYGRGPSMWEEYFQARPELDNGAVACGHYTRMREDVRLMKRMGLHAYRFSVSWPRVLPQGYGKVNEQGMEFYDRLVDELLAQGIEPFLTLYHWDLPQALSKLGGWTNRETCARFADYAALMAKRLGDRVANWATLNEPEVIVAGYTGDGLAPGLSNPKLRTHAGHHLMVAHGMGVQALRSVASNLKTSIVLNLVPVEPATADATTAARHRWRRDYGWYLDGVLKARYPDVILEEAERHGARILAGDMALMSQRLDALGINWYLRLVVNASGDVVPVPAAEQTQMGWEICPAALSGMLVLLQQEYGAALPPIYITENGAALDDTVKGGRIHDVGRTRYIHDHLSAIESAIAAGVDMRGYFVWSFMDNLEWSLGFKKTFGIVHVDRKTLRRTVKDSGRWYSRVIAINGEHNWQPGG